MNAVVVYESVFSNTRQVAEAIGAGLAESTDARVVPVGDAHPDVLVDVGLLVVGGPTHAHGMMSRLTRKGAIQDAEKRPGAQLEPGMEGPVLRGWFDELGPAGGRPAAAFDTRIGKSRLLTGSAAKGIARRLHDHGFELIGEESFIVDDSPGPLHPGELDRAREWGRALGRKLATVPA